MTFTEALMLQALGRKPESWQVAIIDAVLVTIMEHGLVPSAVVTRLTHYGAPESFQGAIAAGLLGVGDRYAGTASHCGILLERIVAGEDPAAQARAEVEALCVRKEFVPGFGHPIHHGVDPRVDKLIAVCRGAGTEGRYLDAMQHLEKAIHEITGKQLVTNISAVLAAAMAEAGVPSGMMRGVVLTARCAGLVGHLFEEMQNPIAAALWDGAQEPISYDDSQ